MDDSDAIPPPLPALATSFTKLGLQPSCAVFTDTLPSLSHPSPSATFTDDDLTPPPSPADSPDRYDYFRWRARAPTFNDPSSTAPQPPPPTTHDQPPPPAAAALGAWYAFATHLQSPLGAALYADQQQTPPPRRRRLRTRCAAQVADDHPSPGCTARAAQCGHPSPSTAPYAACECSLVGSTSPSTPELSASPDSAVVPCIVPSLRHPEPARPDPRVPAADEITAEQVANGVDIQGINWEELHFSRADYRATRMSDTSRTDTTNFSEGLKFVLSEPRRGAKFYDFFKNSRCVKCSIVHFQLRNLAWATSNHDVFVMRDNTVEHWDAAAKRKTQVLDLSGSSMSSGLVSVQISTMIAKDDLVIAGGFYGEMVAKNLRSGTIIHNKRITYDDNAITNAMDIFDDTIMTSNNDCYVRCFDIQTFKKKSSFQFSTAVNHATRQPDGKMVVVAGDDHTVQVIDGDSGERISQLHGHGHYSFATGWHPNSRMFATGSQDRTCRIWDVRNMSQSIRVLGGHIGAVRSLRFSACGKFMVMAEPRDFVHIFRVNRGEFDTCQEVDFFGEIAGIALTPDAEGLYVAVSDRLYSSLMEYDRRNTSPVLDIF